MPAKVQYKRFAQLLDAPAFVVGDLIQWAPSGTLQNLPPIAVSVGAQNLAGMVNRTDSTLSFVDGTRTFTIAPVAVSFDFWTNNTKWTKSAPVSVVIANTVGTHFIYFDAAGALIETTAVWDVTSDQIAMAATVYWDGSTGVVGEERHSFQRDRNLHAYLHNTRGTAYQDGLGGTFTNTTLSIAAGDIYDEDLKLAISGPQTTCRLWYRNLLSQMVTVPGATAPYAASGGVLQWDSAGTLTAVTNSFYVASSVYATDSVNSPIAVVVSQAQYATIGDARAAAEPSFPNLSVREWKLLYSAIYQNVGGVATFIEAGDFRTVSSLPGGNITTLPASAVTFVPGADLSSTNVQSAILELDSKRLSTTLGTANGLSVLGQTLSLALAIAGGANGALAGADKTKLDATSGTNSGDVTIGAPAAATTNALSIAGQVLSSTPADATHPGHVNTDGQTFAGIKTFSSVIDAPGITNTTGASTATLKGNVANGASAVGVVVDNAVSLTIPGAKSLSVRNNTVEQSFFDRLGHLSANVTRTNICLNSTNFAQASWVKTGSIVAAPIVVAAAAADPSGGTGPAPTPAYSIQFPATASGISTIAQAITLTVATYVFSVWLKSAGASFDTYLYAYNGVAGFSGTTRVTVTGAWQRFFIALTGTVASWSFGIGADLATAGTTMTSVPGGTLYAFGAQVEQSNFGPTGLISTAGAAVTKVEGATHQGDVADSVSAVAAIIDAPGGLATASSVLLSVRNAGQERFSVDRGGTIAAVAGTLSSTLSVSGAVYTPTWYSSGAASQTVMSQLGDAAGTVYLTVNGFTMLQTAGARLLSANNSSVEQAYLDKAGRLGREVTRNNLCVQAENFGAANWVKTGNIVAAPIVTIDQVANPLSSAVTADQVQFPATASGASTITQVVTLTAAPYIFSVWLKSAGASFDTYLYAYNAAAGFKGTLRVTVTNAWQRFFTPAFTGTAASWSVGFGADLATAGTTMTSVPGGTLYAFGGMCEKSNNGLSSYIVTSATTVALNEGPTLVTGQADSATSVAAVIDTVTQWVTAGAKLLSLRSGGIEVGSFDRVGSYSCPGAGTLYMGGSITSAFKGFPGGSMTFNSTVTDGASAVGFTMTSGALANAAAKLLSLVNGVSEKVYVTKDGTASVANLTGLHATPAYSASVPISAVGGWVQTVVVTNGSAFTVANPTGAIAGMRLVVRIKNTSGGALGVLTWDTLYKTGTAWTQPATGFSRSIEFFYDGANWVELFRSAADIAN